VVGSAIALVTTGYGNGFHICAAKVMPSEHVRVNSVGVISTEFPLLLVEVAVDGMLFGLLTVVKLALYVLAAAAIMKDDDNANRCGTFIYSIEYFSISTVCSYY
jgi:hypothetical protein